MPIRILKKDKNKSEPKKRFDPRTGEETNKPGGKDPRTIYAPKPQIPPERQMRTGGLSPKQKAIASKAPPPDKIDGKDFAVLKAEKAKGRGMGLQDESIKPGKVQKAFLGKMIKGAGKSVGRLFGRKQSATATPGAMVSQKASLPINLVEEYKKAKGLKVGGVMKANKGKMTPLKKDPTTPVNPFEKRRKQLGGGKLKALGRVMGSRAALLGFVGAGAAAGLNMAGRKLKEFADKKKDKKMGGGMMKKYSVGGGADMSRKNKKSKSGSSVKDIFKSYGKYDGKPIELSKGGGADTGRMGEMKSKISVAMDRASRRSRDKDRLTTRDKEEAINIIRRRSRNQDRITPGDIQGPMKKERFNQEQEQRLKNLSTKELFGELGFSKKMGGGMMQRPMGYKKGTMVKARGCKLGRSKPTKMY